LSSIVVPTTSIEALIHHPEFGVTGPPPQHGAQNNAPNPDDEPLMLATPKPDKDRRQPKRDQQHGNADEGMFDEAFSHCCEAE